MELFGFEIKRKDPAKDIEDPGKRPSFVVPTNDDGSVLVSDGFFSGMVMDLEGTVKSEAELIQKYRDMELYPDVDAAIDDIVNGAIATDEEDVVKINLDGFEEGSSFADEGIQQIIQDEFQEVLELMDFNNKAYEIFRRWYVDGRIYYNVIIDEQHPEEGIKEVRFVDPRKIRKVRQLRREKDPQTGVSLQAIAGEYYIYSEIGFLASGSSSQSYSTLGNDAPIQGLRIGKDSVVHVTSGLTDASGNLVLSYLHKAIKPLNQLKALQDSMVIYRFTRSPARRVFYIDIGANMSPVKGEQYIRDLMVKHKNKVNYNLSTGEISDDRKFMTMFEDYWLARREGKGTEIDTLAGLENTGNLEDIEHIQQLLYRALNVPVSHLLPDQSTFNFSRGAEIDRDELKFQKFVDRLRRRFSIIFFELLIKQLKMKNVIGPDDEAELYRGAWFEFATDQHFTDLKDLEIQSRRIEAAKDIQDLVGKYYSHEYVRKRILRQTDDEIMEQDAQVDQESMDPKWAQPITVMDPTFGSSAAEGLPDPLGMGVGAPSGGMVQQVDQQQQQAKANTGPTGA